MKKGIRTMKARDYDEDISAMMEILGHLYFHMASEMLKLGPEGEEALRRAVRAFGRDRAIRLKKIHQEKGLPINLLSLFTHYDLPGTETSHFKRDVLQLDEDARISLVYDCHFCDIWEKLGGKAALRTLGQIYCNEFHPAMWSTYDPDITVKLPQLLTMGDPYCRTEAHRNVKAKNKDE
jgi:hypothetical protein